MSREVAENFKEALWKVEEDCEVGKVAVPKTFHGHDEAREFWASYRKTFDEMKSTFRNVFRAALEWTTEGTENGHTVSYEGVSILDIEGDGVKRFMAYFDSAHLNRQIVD